ncbi:MAG: hypothetical protein ABSF67_00785 [Roseiarcus sp.]|jgi:hypothetical protein
MSAAFRIAAVLCLALALAGCGRSASYRYKLTLSVDTPEGVKTGFNVVEIDYWAVTFPAQGEPHKTRGQGIYLDLGPGRRPLIALLTRIRRANDSWPIFLGWGLDDPMEVIYKACLGKSAVYSFIDVAQQFDQCQRPLAITPADLPDLVTFADVDDPKSIMLVDPNDLRATLGPGVSWKSITIETTGDRPTKGIDEHLSWVREYKPNMPLVVPQKSKYGEPFIGAPDFLRD